MSGGLAQRVQSNTVANREAGDPETQVREAIKRRLPTIKALLPDVLDERKLAALVITEVHKTPKLAQCDEASLIGCVLRAAALGLQFGQDLGEVFLIPRQAGQRGMECTLQLGYKGVIRLAERSGRIRSITTRSVYACDEFSYEYGLNERLDHKPGPADQRTADQLTHAYCVARYTNGGHDFEVLTRPDIEARRARGKGAQPAWQTDYPKMAEKSALLAMRARLPLTTEVATAFAQDGAAITVTSRGPAALEAHHEPVELDPPRVVDGATGEIHPGAAAPADGDDPHRPPAPDDTVPISAEDAQMIHKSLGQMGLTAPLHKAVIIRASNGRTSHASQLTAKEAHHVLTHAKACAVEPAGLVQWCLRRLQEGTDEAKELEGWLRDQEPAT